MRTSTSRRVTTIIFVGLVAVWQIAMASSDGGTLQVGRETEVCAGEALNILDGYSSALSFGSYSPTGLTGGTSVSELVDHAQFHGACGGTGSGLTISGFSSNPGSTWLTSVTCNGVTNDASAAITYTYSGGVAEWAWTQQFGLAPKDGSNVSCTIVHS